VASAEKPASREEIERARAGLPTVSIVASPPPSEAPAAHARAAAPHRLASRSRTSITGIGFHPTDGGIVLVRSDHPLDYAVSGEGREVVVHLRGATIPLASNRLPLDTRFFGTSVVRIVTDIVGDGVDLHIELRAQTRYQLQQAGDVLTIAFQPA
jgi:hypothetical protein